jgi:hypothetical protein
MPLEIEDNILYEDENICLLKEGVKYTIYSKHAGRDHKGYAIYELEALTNYYRIELKQATVTYWNDSRGYTLLKVNPLSKNVQEPKELAARLMEYELFVRHKSTRESAAIQETKEHVAPESPKTKPDNPQTPKLKPGFDASGNKVLKPRNPDWKLR